MIPLDFNYIAIARFVARADVLEPDEKRIPKVASALNMDVEKLRRYVDLVKAAIARGVVPLDLEIDYTDEDDDDDDFFESGESDPPTNRRVAATSHERREQPLQ